MNFTTIWSLRGLPLKERINRTLDLWSMLVYDILPKRVAFWVAMRAIGKATVTSQNIPATSLDNILRNLGNIREGKLLESFEWHESMKYPEDDHSVHIHVNPAKLQANELAQKMRDHLGGASGESAG